MCIKINLRSQRDYIPRPINIKHCQLLLPYWGEVLLDLPCVQLPSYQFSDSLENNFLWPDVFGNMHIMLTLHCYLILDILFDHAKMIQTKYLSEKCICASSSCFWLEEIIIIIIILFYYTIIFVLIGHFKRKIIFQFSNDNKFSA